MAQPMWFLWMRALRHWQASIPVIYFSSTRNCSTFQRLPNLSHPPQARPACRVIAHPNDKRVAFLV
jgi:hypothetical protein